MKSFCILEQGRSVNDPLTKAKKKLFTTDFCDFYRLNWEQANDEDAFICRDHIVWSEGRALLYENVPKDYEYYIFTDDDIKFSSLSEDIPSTIKFLFEKYKPLTGTFIDVDRFVDPDLFNFMGGLDLDSCLAREAFPVAGYDQQLQFYSRSYADAMFPAPYHGAGMSMWYAQWACQKQFPGKQLCFTDVQVNNSRADTHSNEKRTQHIPGNIIVALFNSDVVDSSFCWNLSEIQRRNKMVFDMEVDARAVDYKISDLAKIYDLSNVFYQTRVPVVNDVTEYANSIAKKASEMVVDLNHDSAVNATAIERDRRLKLSRVNDV